MRTSEGWELQFATNHLDHFALALGLHDALASAGGARIVSVSSSGHLASPVVFAHVLFAFEAGWRAAEAAGRFTPKTTQQGAATTLVAAVAPELDGIGRRYLEDCNEAETVADDAEVSRGVRAWALDTEAAGRLREVSLPDRTPCVSTSPTSCAADPQWNARNRDQRPVHSCLPALRLGLRPSQPSS